MRTYVIAGLTVGGLILGACTPSTQSVDSMTSPTAESQPADETAMNQNNEMTASTIVDIAQANADFSTLVEAVVAADLVDTLSSEGPFTVFAPTNDAFAELPEGTLASLLEDPAALADVLTYHVVSGKILSTDLSDGQTAVTVNGEQISVSLDESGVMINESSVVMADIEASNGVIHVIDQVLIPAE